MQIRSDGDDTGNGSSSKERVEKSMAAKRYLPSNTKLQEMVERGMTHREIAAEVSRRGGVRVSREAVSAALSRAGLTHRIRYEDFIPWRVSLEHQHAYDLWMLRLAAREARGLKNKPGEQSRLNVWRERLREAGAVVHYDHESSEGFYYVKRERGDKGLIREPRAPARLLSGKSRGGGPQRAAHAATLAALLAALVL